MSPKKFVHNTRYSVQPPYIAGHSLEKSQKIVIFLLLLHNLFFLAKRMGTDVLKISKAMLSCYAYFLAKFFNFADF